MSWKKLLIALAPVALLLWPALYNGQPFFFPDTTAYVSGAGAGVSKIFGAASPWHLPGTDSATEGADSAPRKSIQSGRSIYYGLLLYLGDLTTRFWLTAILQAAALVAAMYLTLNAMGPFGAREKTAIAAVVALASAAPFFASMLMPDAFAAVTILACAVLLGSRGSRRPLVTWSWFALLALSVSFHASHLLVAASFLVLALVVNAWRGRWPNTVGLCVVAAAMLVSVLGDYAFTAGVQKYFGTSPLRPPFLTARLIADGPGLAFVRATCPNVDFAICDFADRLPADSDTVLWDADPRTGIFASASPAARLRLSQQDTRFVLAVLRHDPAGVIRDSMANALRQAFMTGLPEFSYSSEHGAYFIANTPAKYHQRLEASPAFQGTIPVGAFGALVTTSTVAGALVLLMAAGAARIRRTLGSAQVRITAFCLAGMAINAIICGVLSGPRDRYSARVAWLPVFLACAVAAAYLRSLRGRLEPATET